MDLIDWTEEFSVGVERIDHQHKGLIKLINNLHQAMRVGKGRVVISETLDKLIEYTATHFKTEEELFKKYQYSEFSIHKKEHDDFVEKVLKFKKDYDSNHLMLTFEVMDFLKNWLVKHILGSDKNYKEFFNSQGLK